MHVPASTFANRSFALRALATVRSVGWRSERLCPFYAAIRTSRDAYGRVVHLYGDSLMRGYALGRYADQAAPTHPHYDRRAPAHDLNARSGGAYTAAYAGVTGAPVAVSPRLGVAVAKRLVRGGDVVVLEAAGDHGGEAEPVAQTIADARAAIASSGAHVIVLTAFDAIDPERFPHRPVERFQWSLDLGAGSTMNDALIDGAQRGAAPPAEVLDIRPAFAAAVRGDEPVMQADGVHFTVQGQGLLADLLHTAVMDALARSA